MVAKTSGKQISNTGVCLRAHTSQKKPPPSFFNCGIHPDCHLEHERGTGKPARGQRARADATNPSKLVQSGIKKKEKRVSCASVLRYTLSGRCALCNWPVFPSEQLFYLYHCRGSCLEGIIERGATLDETSRRSNKYALVSVLYGSTVFLCPCCQPIVQCLGVSEPTISSAGQNRRDRPRSAGVDIAAPVVGVPRGATTAGK